MHKRILLFLAALCVFSSAANAQSIPPTRWIEADGSPSLNPPRTVIVPNGSISGTTVTLTGGGGSGCTPPGTVGRVLYDTGGGGCGSITGATTNGTVVTLTNALATTAFSPSSNDGATLGSGTASFSDLFLASGALINFANGNVVLTHSSGILTMGTGELRITTVGTNAASVPTLGSASTLTNKTLTTPTIADFSNANHNHSNSAGGGQVAIGSGISGLGTGVATALAVNVGSAGAFVTFNGAGGTPSSLTLTNAAGLQPTTGIVGWPADASGCLSNDGMGALSWAACGGGGGSGTVTSVAQSFTGGLISVSGSPVTTSGTLALTVAGTSGGVPYFSDSSTWASSAALAANAIVLGGGAGAAPATTTTGTGVVTALGVNVGSAGAFVVNGGALGTPSSGTLTNAAGLPLSTGVTGTLAVGNGGTGLASYTAGDLPYASGTTTIAKLAIGTAAQCLKVNAGATAPEWGACGSGSPGGSTGDYQINSGGSFAAGVLAQGSTGRLTATPTLQSSGVASYFRVITPADTGQTASTEVIGAQFGGNTSAATVTRQWATGALTAQRENLFVAPTYAFVGSSTLATAVNVEAASPIAGTNATLTNSFAARFIASAAGHTPLVVKAAGSQSADLIRGVSSADANLFRVGSDGIVYTASINNIGATATRIRFPSGNHIIGMVLNGVDYLYFDGNSSPKLAYMGNGDVNASPATGILQGTGGSGSNVAGGPLNFNGGRGTGTGNGGSIVFSTSPAGSSGSSLNPLATAFTIAPDGVAYPKAYTHAALPTPVNGNGGFVYCSDCTIASPCASGGTGAFAKRLNSAWVCN